jgi:hypothetical protein
MAPSHHDARLLPPPQSQQKPGRTSVLQTPAGLGVGRASAAWQLVGKKVAVQGGATPETSERRGTSTAGCLGRDEVWSCVPVHTQVHVGACIGRHVRRVHWPSCAFPAGGGLTIDYGRFGPLMSAANTVKTGMTTRWVASEVTQPSFTFPAVSQVGLERGGGAEQGAMFHA